MKKEYIIVFFLLLASCDVEWCNYWNITYINHTDHLVQILSYNGYYDYDDINMNISLSKGETADYRSCAEGRDVPLGNNLIVIYDDTLIVRHATSPGEKKKNLYFDSSYEITDTKVTKKLFKSPDKHEYKAQFVFTEEDYQEALEIYFDEREEKK